MSTNAPPYARFTCSVLRFEFVRRKNHVDVRMASFVCIRIIPTDQLFTPHWRNNTATLERDGNLEAIGWIHPSCCSIHKMSLIETSSIRTWRFPGLQGSTVRAEVNLQDDCCLDRRGRPLLTFSLWLGHKVAECVAAHEELSVPFIRPSLTLSVEAVKPNDVWFSKSDLLLISSTFPWFRGINIIRLYISIINVHSVQHI